MKLLGFSKFLFLILVAGFNVVGAASIASENTAENPNTNALKKFETLKIGSEKQLQRLANLALKKASTDKTAKKSATASELYERWQLALHALKYNDSTLALKLLPTSLELKGTGLPEDHITLTRARANFHAGKLDVADSEYSQIPKSSDFWVIAIEERAQTRGRQGKFQNVIADLTSLNSPLFDTTRGPETYFVEALSYLKTCQFKKVTETIDRFKSHVRPRAISLAALSKTGSSDSLTKAVQGIQKSGMSTLSYAKVAGDLPERFHLDHSIQNEFFKFKNGPTKNMRIRIQALAKEDLKQIASTAKKLHFIEAEMLQRLHKLTESHGSRTTVGDIDVAGNQLQFPYDGESWIDEIDSYKAKIEGCPKEEVN